jgi:hypothetical protein
MSGRRCSSKIWQTRYAFGLSSISPFNRNYFVALYIDSAFRHSLSALTALQRDSIPKSSNPYWSLARWNVIWELESLVKRYVV